MSLAGRDFVALTYSISTYTSLLCLVLIYFIYGRFDGAVIVSDDIASNPVHIGTPDCCNLRSIFYHRRLDILSVLFLQVFRLKFCINYLSRTCYMLRLSLFNMLTAMAEKL